GGPARAPFHFNEWWYDGVRIGLAHAPAITIHGTPNLSATMPKRLAKNVFPIGIWTLPPLARAANSRSASASSRAVSDSEMPLKSSLPEQSPSEAITVAPPTRKLECITLFSLPGGTMFGGGGSGLSL